MIPMAKLQESNLRAPSNSRVKQFMRKLVFEQRSILMDLPVKILFGAERLWDISGQDELCGGSLYRGGTDRIQ